MVDEMTIEEYREYLRTGQLPARFQGQGEPKKRKYHNEPVEIDGLRFDSQAEAKRYYELRMLERSGLIEHLEIHPKLTLTVQGVRIGTYSADFRYYDIEQSRMVLEDVKSDATKTQIYRWKKRHVKAQYGISIIEVMVK